MQYIAIKIAIIIAMSSSIAINIDVSSSIAIIIVMGSIIAIIIAISKSLVPDFGNQYLDTNPDVGQYRHFCGTIIYVSTDYHQIKWEIRTISDKDSVLWKVFI